MNELIVDIKNLSFTYPGGEKEILKNINLQVEKGDFLAIIGNNGCGKSTLCKTINGLIPHFFNGIYAGEVKVAEKNTLEYELGELSQKIGYVYQDFENQIVRPTVWDDASYSCMNYAMEDYLERGKKALEDVGLLNKGKDYVWQLSGGQKHLLALAGMVALSPEVIILDEPIAQLDPSHAKKIYDVLSFLNQKGTTIIVIEHHTEFIAEYCKHVLLMKKGEIVWKKPVKEAITSVEELVENNIFPPQVTQAAYKSISNFPERDKTSNLPISILEGVHFFQKEEFFRRKPTQIEGVKIRKAHEKLLSFHEVSLEFLSVKGNNHKVLDNFNLNIYKGEKIALIGNNGAGKSSIMKLMMGLLKPKMGSISIDGISEKDMRSENISDVVSLVYQNPEEMFIQDSIEKDIAYGMKVRGISGYQEKTKELIRLFQLEGLENRDGRLLSGGQMRRASLAVGVALNPKLLLLDEPTANLDIATRTEMIQVLETLKDTVETVIIATHDMQLVTQWADRIIVLSAGKIVGDGNRSEIFRNASLIEKAGIKPPEIFRLGQKIDTQAECFTVDEFLSVFKSREKSSVNQINQWTGESYESFCS